MARARHVPRVFVAEDLAEGASIVLPDDKRHHLATVLRLSAGDTLILFNGDGAEYAATLTTADRKRAEARIDSWSMPLRESPLEITLLQAVARGDRMDFALAKAVELGVTAIQPVFTARGRVRLEGARLAKKHDHWRRVVESAAEQSGRLIVPSLAEAVDLSMRIDAPPEADRLLMLAPEAAAGLRAQTPAARIALLVGPESGLANDEIEHASTAGWHALALGPRVLRTETAGMATLAALQTAWGDLAG
ncbi:16S rRNA (uracil(1498)-N(3))-methyltransferase [Salinisphaera sp.]|uniref:16S rRNA (uracil(1498)-N(3))-methyltransferase n=1 Tax=Salinisphaera sp. TaxID=1914330 RepID=UPI002D79E25C|nr:16S rRNA (uracil(1498)-N(3))-methyltransferase [Salinisphaera sp.]HET7314548.1 16S rRNA (uracil(1498)-N(3))-methyltransferase [Salinisphaera sp.]